MNIRRTLYKLLFTVMCLMTALTAVCAAAPRTVLILPLQQGFTLTDYEDDQDAEDIIKMMTSRINIEFKGDGTYTVMEPVTYEDKLMAMDAKKITADVQSAAQAGRELGARFVVCGKINEVNTNRKGGTSMVDRILSGFEPPYKSKMVVELQFINCQKEIAILSKTYTAVRGGKNAPEAFKNACNFVAEKFVEDLTNPVDTTKKVGVGRITSVKGEILTVDQGSAAKFFVGESLAVIRKEKEIGRVEVLEIGKEETICRITESKEKIQKGDMLSRD